MPDNTKKEKCCGLCKPNTLERGHGLDTCRNNMCGCHFTSIDKNKEEEMLWCDRQGDSKCKECKCVCHQTGYNLPKDFPSPQPPLSDDWEERFDERFPLHEISESNNLWGDYTLFELHDAIIDLIKKEVCQQRIQAQRELARDFVEMIDNEIRAQMSKDDCKDMAMNLKTILIIRGLLSNNKE